MRPVLAVAALALLLGACTVRTEGAPCETDANCPTGQGCGSDGTCSAAALSCPDHTSEGQCSPGLSCDGQGRVVTCTASTPPCATSSAASCAPGQSCLEANGTASCECPATGAAAGQGCAPENAGACSGVHLLACAPAVAGSSCLTWHVASDCAPAQTCVDAGGAAACQCPAAGAETGQGCAVANAVSCGGTQVLRCQPAATGSPCLTWQVATDCGAAGLVCAAGACACPAADGVTLLADAVAGSPATAVPPPNGASSPARCRFATLADALAAAASGGRTVVKGTGWSASLPGGVMTFTEGDSLTVPSGVTLTTDETPPSPGHYLVVAAGGGAAQAAVTLPAGATIEGFEVHHPRATANGIATACTTATGTATIRSVRVVGTGTGTPAAGTGSGVRHGGTCSLVLTGSTITGAGNSGLVLENAAASSSATITGNVFTGNDAAVEYLLASGLRRGGGVALVGILPGTFTFKGNQVHGNRYDQALIYASAAVSLSGRDPALADPAGSCGGSSPNSFGCYAAADGGVGVSASASTDLEYNRWPRQPPVPGTDTSGGPFTGTNLTCPVPDPPPTCP